VCLGGEGGGKGGADESGLRLNSILSLDVVVHSDISRHRCCSEDQILFMDIKRTHLISISKTWNITVVSNI